MFHFPSTKLCSGKLQVHKGYILATGHDKGPGGKAIDATPAPELFMPRDQKNKYHTAGITDPKVARRGSISLQDDVGISNKPIVTGNSQHSYPSTGKAWPQDSRAYATDLIGLPVRPTKVMIKDV